MAVTFVGVSTANSNTVAPPAHVADDILLILAFNSVGTTRPALPTGWTNIADGTFGSPIRGYRIGWRRATAPGTSSGSWTGGNRLLASVYRGAVNTSSPIGSVLILSDTSTTITYDGPEDGFVIGIGFAQGVGVAAAEVLIPPSGMTNRGGFTGSGFSAGFHDTDGMTGFAGGTASLTSSGLWLTHVFRMIELSVPVDADADGNEAVISLGEVALSTQQLPATTGQSIGVSAGNIMAVAGTFAGVTGEAISTAIGELELGLFFVTGEAVATFSGAADVTTQQIIEVNGGTITPGIGTPSFLFTVAFEVFGNEVTSAIGHEGIMSWIEIPDVTNVWTEIYTSSSNVIEN